MKKFEGDLKDMKKNLAVPVVPASNNIATKSREERFDDFVLDKVISKENLDRTGEELLIKLAELDFKVGNATKSLALYSRLREYYNDRIDWVDDRINECIMAGG